MLDCVDKAKVCNTRIEYIDVYRGIGILLMVLDHIGLGSYFYHLIHAFHMPMFFFIAGFCYKKKTENEIGTREFIVKKAKSLLVPYFIFGITEYLVWYLYKGHSIEPLKHLFWINTEGLAIAGALWFLTSLFVVEGLFFLIDRYWDKRVKIIFIVFLSILGCFWTRLFSFRLPFGIDIAFVGVGLFFLGTLFNKKQDQKIVNRLLNLKIYESFLLLMLTWLLIYTNRTINMRNGHYEYVCLFWINACLSIITLINISKFICEHFRIMVPYIMSVGKAGIAYVCINQFVITVFKEIIERIASNSVVQIVFLVPSVLISLYLISYIMLSTRFKILCGK